MKYTNTQNTKYKEIKQSNNTWAKKYTDNSEKMKYKQPVWEVYS